MANNQSNGVSTLERFGERIGKSLIKFFKPIRIASPHRKEQKPSIQAFISFDEEKRKTQLMDPASTPNPDKLLKTDEVQEVILEPDGNKGSWLDSVVYMLKTCKKMTQKMKVKSGLQTYEETARVRSQNKFKSRGSIIDVESSSLQFLESDQDKDKKAA